MTKLLQLIFIIALYFPITLQASDGSLSADGHIYADSTFPTESALPIDWGHLSLFGQLVHSDQLSRAPGSNSEKLSDASLDILYTGGSSRFPMLAEYFYDSEDHDKRLLNRLQFGWRPSENTTLWVGKFNNPNLYWHDRYHDGLYFSPSVMAPLQSAVFFDGGVTAPQISGLRLDHAIQYKQSEWRFNFVAANGPEVLLNKQSDVKVEDFFKDFSNDQRLYIAGLSFLPDALGETEVGVRYSKVNAPWRAFDFTGFEFNLDETVFNVYANLEVDSWRFLLSYSKFKQEINVPEGFAAFTANLDPSNPINASFLLAANLGVQVLDGGLNLRYLHVEYQFNEHWLAYVREEQFEVDAPTEAKLALAQFGVDCEYDKHIAGVRYDFRESHALSLQYSNYRSSISGQEQSTLHLVWSFALEVGE